MVDANALKQIFSLQSAAWTGVALLFLFVVRMWSGAPAMLEQWVALRRARAEERAADWVRLREEITRLSKAEQQCREDYASLHTKHMEVVERLTVLESYHIGQGKAAQEAAGIVAIERLKKENGE